MSESMGSRLARVRGVRADKLRLLREHGVDPFGQAFPDRVLAARLQADYANGADAAFAANSMAARVAGRVISLRPQGRVGFCHLQDTSGRIQIYVKVQMLDDQSQLIWRQLDLGDILGVDGVLMRTHTGELTVRAAHLTMLTKAMRPLPDKHGGLQDREERYRARHLDLLVNPESRAVFEARSRIITALRRLLNDLGFLEVETPILVPLAGGAAARPFMTHHNTLSRDLSLRIATELHLKRLVVGGLERVYEIGRVFRNEGLSTRHNPEFTSLELYQAYADYRDMMDLTEQMIQTAAMAANGSLQVGGYDLSGPWRRITMAQAVLAATGIDFDALPTDEAAMAAVQASGYAAHGNTWGALLAGLFEEHAEPGLPEPVFVTHHPVETSPLARRDAHDPRLTERFELYVAGRELANAFSELTDAVDQRSRLANLVNRLLTMQTVVPA